jgi:hypothetical protein
MAEGTPSGNAPAPDNAGTPPAGEQTPSPYAVEESISLKKTEHDTLQKQAAQASEAQHRADTLEKEIRDLKRGFKRKVVDTENFKPEEILEVKSKVTARLITSEKYRDLVAKRPELAKILAKNPLTLLEVDQFIDAEDAADQVFDYLDELSVNTEVPKAQPTPPETPPSSPVIPNPEGQAVKTLEQQQEAELQKLPVMDRMEQKLARRFVVK